MGEPGHAHPNLGLPGSGVTASITPALLIHHTYFLPRVEGPAIDGRLQLYGRRVTQGSDSEASRFGHLDELGDALGWLVTVKRQLRLDGVARRACIAGEDRAFALIPRGDCDADIARLDVQRS